MPNNRKIFIHDTFVEITFRTEEGLPFCANPLIIAILQSIFARAQTFHQVKLCHLMVMANHVHMLIVVHDPGDVPRFVEYVKKESAHAVNRLLGRKKHTVWADGYDSPTILDAQTAKERIAYLYTNPPKANLVDKIDQYPHFSSWEAFSSGKVQKLTAKRFTRDSLEPLPDRTLGLAELRALAVALTTPADESELSDNTDYQLVFEPNAWLQCFDETRSQKPETINAQIVEMIRTKEQLFRSERTSQVVGAHALQLERIRKPHVPRKRGKRMLCLSSLRQLRRDFLGWYRNQCACVFSATFFPPGLFLPGGKLIASVVPWIVPSANTVFLS